MAEIIRMPKMSDTMTEGVVVKWHKKEGDKVKTGELLAEIETDKATMEFESYYDGVLLKIGVKEKEAALVDAILAVIGKEGEDYKSQLEAEEKKSVATPTDVKKELAAEKPVEAPLVAAKVAETKPAPVKIEEPVLVSSDANGRLKASPLAKKLAGEKGIDLSMLKGTGEHGRIVKRDIDWFKPSGFVSSGGRNLQNAKESFEEIPVSQMRKTIARRLSESKFTAPHFYLTMDIDMDECVKARESINAVAPAKISFNDLVIKAVAASLLQHPAVNSSWLGDRIRINHHIHIGVAVAVEEGLLVPVVRFADQKTLSQINGEVKTFAQKAKDKKLQPQDWEGNTFTISNLGMFNIEEFTAIINTPDACILAVSAIKQIPVVKNGIVQAGQVMKVTLSCDHRVVDGVTGAKFLNTLKGFLENPVILLGQYSI